MRIAGKATLYLRRQRFGDISKHSLVRRDAEPAPVKSTSSMTGATLPRASVRCRCGAATSSLMRLRCEGPQVPMKGSEVGLF